VRAGAEQLERLLARAGRWPERTWAVENAGGLGYLLAQQLISAGERVVDVPPKLAARVRLLNTGDTNKNDPNDARSVAIPALRSPAVRPVAAEDHQAVMKPWAKSHRELAAIRTQVVSRLHAVLCELIPAGIRKRISAKMAVRLLENLHPGGAVAQARYELACDYVIDLLKVDDQIRQANKHIATAVKASGTTMTNIFGVGPYVAATVKGEVGDICRFKDRDHFAAYNGTAPIEASSGPRKITGLSRKGNRRLNHAIHMVAVTQVSQPHSPGRAYYDRKIAEGKTGKEALRSLKRRISDVVYAALVTDGALQAKVGLGGQTGSVSDSSATGSHPAKPGLRISHSRTRTQAYDRPSQPAATHTHGGQKIPPSILTRKEDSDCGGAHARAGV
jgi:transposase